MKSEAGDKVKVVTRKEEVEGMLLESPEPGIVLLKLASGYNIGIKKEDILDIELLEKRKEKENKEIRQEKKDLPYVDVIITGGTISSRVDYETGGVKWITKPEELLALYPEIFNVVNIRKIKVPFMKASENVSWKDWKLLAEEVAESLNDKKVAGVIVTHGTDFLHYTSAALSFFLGKLNKPVVLTFAQRSSDRASSDAALNLLCSAHAAISDIAEVMIVGHATTNDNFCYALKGVKTRKLHSSRRDAFKAVNTKPIAKIFPDGKIEKIKEYNVRNDKERVKVDALYDDKIALIKYYPGQKSDIIDYISQNFKGVIIEGSGMGHVASEEAVDNWLPAIKKAINNGLIVCMTTQTIFGKVDPYVYAPARKLEKAGVIYLRDMPSETAFVKLGWVLGHKSWKNFEKVREKMLENITGEIGERLEE